MHSKIEMQAGKIYFLKYGGTEIVGRFKEEDVCNYYWYDYLHQWAGYETFRQCAGLHSVKHGVDEMREATQTEKQALLRKSIEHNSI
jgi:hypothetical protein